MSFATPLALPKKDHKLRRSTPPCPQNFAPVPSGVRKAPRPPNRKTAKTNGYHSSKMATHLQDNDRTDDNKPRHDVILAMQEPYMQQIVSGDKSYKFRKYRLKDEVKWAWFYRTAPHSALDYVCEIEPARTRGPDQIPLPEPGLGNDEFNTGHKDWEGYDFAYKIVSVYKLKRPLLLQNLREEHGMKSAPRGWMYTPKSILESVAVEGQERLR